MDYREGIFYEGTRNTSLGSRVNIRVFVVISRLGLFLIIFSLHFPFSFDLLFNHTKRSYEIVRKVNLIILRKSIRYTFDFINKIGCVIS